MKFIKLIKSNKISHRNGKIYVFQKSKKIKFNFQRVFVVKSNLNQIRGRHAHKKCIQLLSCLNGKIKIFCESKSGKKKNFILDNPEKFLIIPKMTWSIQKYLKKNTILMVICSRNFSEKDYIRDYAKFKKF